MLTPQETFRQLALDMNAVTKDDPNLSHFVVTIEGAHVDVRFKDYKSSLRIWAKHTVERRPTFIVARRGPLDRLGQRLGVDEVQVPADAAFNKAYEISFPEQSIDPLSARHAVASMFADAGARDAVRAADAAGILPVELSSSGASWESFRAGRGDLQVAPVEKIGKGLARLTHALPDVPASGPNMEPLVDVGGRRVIRRVRREGPLAKLLDFFDIWPVFALVAGVILVGLSGGTSHFVSHHVWVAALAFVAPVLVAAPGLLAYLRGTQNAFSYILWRTLGVATLCALVAYFGAHAVDVLADHATPITERATVSITRASFGPLPGASVLRTERNETIRLSTDDIGKDGAQISVDVHPGRLGWTWVEKTPRKTRSH